MSSAKSLGDLPRSCCHIDLIYRAHQEQRMIAQAPLLFLHPAPSTYDVERYTSRWLYDHHIYKSYSGAFYHARMGACDVVFAPLSGYPSRMQCFADPLPGESFGNSTACPLYKSPENATTTDSMWTAGCCGRFVSTASKFSMAYGRVRLPYVECDRFRDHMAVTCGSKVLLLWPL